MRTALVVEDDASIQHLLSELLREQGFGRVHAATSASEAVGVALNNPLDLVVLDYRLGQVSGIEIAERLRSLPGFRAPVLVTTALPQRKAEEVCAAADACECVAKPFDITEFLEAVESCLRESERSIAV